jgi:hypothetical protein
MSILLLFDNVDNLESAYSLVVPTLVFWAVSSTTQPDFKTARTWVVQARREQQVVLWVVGIEDAGDGGTHVGH